MKKINKIMLIILSIFFFIMPVKAATSASAGLNAKGTIYNGDTVDVVLFVNEVGSVDGEGISGIQGPVTFDNTKLDLIGTSSHALNVQYNSGRIIGMAMSPNQYLTGSRNVITLTFRAKATGNATISIQTDLSDASNNKVFSRTVSKTISIVDPPSGNNNLANITLSTGSVNFNPGNTHYKVTVDANVDKININATAEDSGASISGLGNKNLNYGNNDIKLVVTAANGNKKTYTVTVIRKDNRSSNNNLASLNISNGKLSPNFSKGTTNYNMEVPYSVSSLNINAKPEDDKSKVNISNNNLIAEETTTVRITVTAENGVTKTYTINVKRGKDPNKVLSTNNYLSMLSVNVGILSPAFDKTKENYAVYLPYEVESIEVNALVEDSKYATIKREGNTNLIVGDNIIKLIVTAEDLSKKTYTIKVVRNASLDDVNLSNNTNLKSLKLKNGSLKGKFKKNVHLYKYSRGKKKLVIDAIPEDTSSNVNIYEVDDIVVIMVESQNGSRSFYILIPKGLNILLVVLTILIISGVILYFVKHKKNKIV